MTERSADKSAKLPYIKPVPYEDLVRANRKSAIDAQSQQILSIETEYLKKWRSSSGAQRSTDNVDKTIAALALSGGGIRSATFALGVTQAFAAEDLMRRFDYLSTV